MTKKTNKPDGLSHNNCWHGKAYNEYNEWEGVCVCVCVCNLAFVFRHAHTFFADSCFIVTRNLSNSTIFLHIISQRSRFSKHILSTKCVFWFSLQLLSETFLVLRRIGRDIIINVYWCSVQYRYCCQHLMELLISQQVFEKCSNIRYHENPSSGSRGFP